MKILNEQMEAAYEVAKRVHERKLSRAAGIQELEQRSKLKHNSASDTIITILHMVNGERYERTANIFATDHFLKMIHRDFGLPGLKRAISAVEQRLEYEARRKGSKFPTIRKIVQKYRDILKEGLEDSFARQERLLDEAGVFDPTNDTDGRERTIAAIVRRQGQPAFRRRMLVLYQTRCAISDCGVEAALEAAHILPYRGRKTNHPTNGLLLRGDLHTLFDLGLIAVDVEKMAVVIAPELKGTCHEELAGKKLKVPENAAESPNREALIEHRSKRSKT